MRLNAFQEKRTKLEVQSIEHGESASRSLRGSDFVLRISLGIWVFRHLPFYRRMVVWSSLPHCLSLTNHVLDQQHYTCDNSIPIDPKGYEPQPWPAFTAALREPGKTETNQSSKESGCDGTSDNGEATKLTGVRGIDFARSGPNLLVNMPLPKRDRGYPKKRHGQQCDQRADRSGWFRIHRRT